MKQLLTFLFFLSISWFSAHADNDVINDACPGEEIAAMNVSGSANHEEGPGYLTKSGDAVDIYHFQIDADGTLELYLSADNDTNVYFGTGACGSNPLALSAALSGLAEVNIVSGQTVTVRLERDKNEDVVYGFDLVFKEAQDPVAIEDNVETYVDTAIDIDVTANDQDDGSIDKTTVTIVTDVSNGTTSKDPVTGVVTYTPNAGFSGLDNFTYTVKDNIGNVSNTINVLIVVKVPAVSAENCDIGTENGYRDFCLRRQTMLPGNMITTGNTILVAPYNGVDENSNSSADCSTYTNGTYIDNATLSNDNYNLCAYHVGGPGTPAATVATVTMPDANNSTVEWAGLYWQALVDDNVTLNGHSIRLKNGSDTYETFTYDKLNYQSSGFSSTNAYSAFKDVTTILQTNNWKDGNYTVADIPVREGKISGLGTYGAWSLVIIYRNNSESIRSFTVFDGWRNIDTGSGNNNVPIALSGFYTPKDGDINASVSVFAAEGDKHIAGDTLTVEDQTNGNAEVTLTTVSNNTFHSGIDGAGLRTPNPTNNQGIDIHTYQLGNVNGGENVLAYEQSDLTFRFKTTGDYYWPSMLAFSTEVYTPSFCYDYAYKQNGVFFTEINNDLLRDPRITGFVTDGNDINVSLMILNREDSDVSAKNLKLSIEDINTTQAVYKRNTVSILNPNEVVPLVVPDSSLIVADDFIKDINYADVAGTEKIFTYYTITPDLPSDLNHEINISLNATFTYDLVLPLPSGGEITIPSVSKAGGTNLPLCAVGGQYITKSEWGIFNVVDNGIYSTGNEYYNIPTQVVNRVGDLAIVAYESNSSVADNTETPDLNSTTLIGVDLIDASSYQSVTSACTETSTSKGITPILWMAFKNSNTIDLRQEIQNAIDDDRLDIATVGEYFPNAVKSAAFRVSYLTTNVSDEDLVQTEEVAGGNLKLLNFTDLVQDIGTCKQPVKKFPGSELTTIQVPVACANAGNAGLTPFEMQRCMECLFGYNTNHVCSRDNFSIRPESYNVKINDTNQSNIFKIRLADTVTGVAAPTVEVLDIAAGYKYNFEANATSHTGNEATPGYSRYFNPQFPSESNATLIWTPTDPAINPFCNDISDTLLGFNMINGKINELNNHNNVGKYRFNIIDKGWTKADWDINGDSMKHHRDNPSYFVGGATGIDCDNTTSAIVSNGVNTTNAGGVLTNINGCTIDTNNHDNDDANIRYRDYDMVLHPYDFNISTVQYNKGMFSAPVDINSSPNHYIYMNDVKDDTNMSIRFTGPIRVVAADGNTTLTNFVSGCYARDVSMIVSTSALPVAPLMNYNLQERNVTTDLILSDTDGSFTPGAIAHTVIIPEGNFTRDGRGVSNMTLNFNLDRNVTNAINPITITHNDFNVTCRFGNECESNADLLSNYQPNEGIDENATITYIYGRLHSPRQRVADPDPATLPALANIPLYYEFYCDANIVPTCDITTYATVPTAVNALSPIGLLSPDDVRWYSQALHTTATDGNATATQARSAVDDARFTRSIDPGAQTATYTYDGTRGYPYKATIQLNAPNWLIYNRYDATATFNEFELEFFTTGRWGGQDQSNMSIDANTSTNVNRRIQW